MFSLWYTLLSWKEYKTSRLATKQKADQGPAEESEVKPEVPKVVPEPVNSVDPNENIAPSPQLPQTLHQSTPKSAPISQNMVIETSFPGSTPQDHLNPPPKPPRSPSPHPMRAETFDIEFSSEESDEYDDEEEEEPNSVIDSTVIEQKTKAANIEEFLSAEINGLKREST